METMAWIGITLLLLSCLRLAEGKASEYQLESESLSQCEMLRDAAVARQQDTVPHCVADGRFRGVQCASGGQECWCVDAGGQEILGTRTNNSALHCPTPCQIQRQRALEDAGGGVVPQCQASGEFEPVQCDVSRGQCWCVDLDGMELYGSRQEGRPAHCPGSCEVRARRLLHTRRVHSPPQCSDDGSFLPVQCKFINTTDRSELNLLTSYNRFPESFETFSSFRRTFPLVSSYCYCSDSRGRELPSTGVELLLSEVYDTAFSGLSSGRSFSQSNIYRVLQRRLLGLRLAITGHFRCPTPCETERRAALQASGVFVPSCDASGAFVPRQCQTQGRCWCVDPSGREVPGTRQQGDALVCSAATTDCPSQRRLALSRLLSGPVEPPRPASPCSPELQPLRQLLMGQQPSFLAQMLEVLHGLFPSVGLALQALSFSTSHRLQENLFGGKFLKNAASFNFSGALGDKGALTFSQLGLRLDRDDPLLSAQSLSPSQAPLDLDQNISDDFGRFVNFRQNQNLVQLVSKTLADPAFLSTLKHTLLHLSNPHSASLQQVLTPMLGSCTSEAAAMFVPSCTASGQYQELQCAGGECWCVDPRGQEIKGSRITGQRPRCPSRCERERALAKRMKGSMAASAELYIPACSEDGHFLPLQCVGARCFCVKDDGNVTPTLATGGANACPGGAVENPPVSSASCFQALAKVTAFRQEAEKIISLSNSSHLALGYGFLLAEGLRLTQEELHASQSAEEEQISDRLLSRSKSGLRLAAYSTLQFYWHGQQRAALRLAYQPYTPQCDAHGHWMPTQCHLSTGRCWCVDEDGEYVTGSLRIRSQRLPGCLSRCQRAHTHTMLSGWIKRSDITTSFSFSSKCDERGQFQVLQTGGAAGSCVSPLTGERLQSATQGPGGQFTCPSWCLIGSLQAGRGFQCQEDGTFSPLHCDITSCWCVSENGQEVPQTRTLRSTGSSPSCDRPLCPDPSITHGALLCNSVAGGRQSCDLICHHGYQNALPVTSFLCDAESQEWETDTPLIGACQRTQPFQTMESSVEVLLSLFEDQTCSSLLSSLHIQILSDMATRGLCSLQLPASGGVVSLCDDSSVHLQCDSDDIMRLKVKRAATFSDLPTSDFPDLHDLDVLLNESSFLAGLQGLLGSYHTVLSSEPELVSLAQPSFGCSHGFHPDTEGTGCVVCPAGSFSKEGVCLPCPQGTYQDEEGRDFCNKCTRGTTAIGASSVSQCVTKCQRQGLRCSDSGDFLSVQHDFLSGHWRCVTTEGEELEWTNSNEPLSDEECTVLRSFEAVPESDLLMEAEDTEVLLSQISNRQTCLQACAVETSCHYVALFTEEGQTHCDLYRTHTHCNSSLKARGFLGNAQAELFDRLSCSVRVRGGASDLLVVRKKGHEFSTRLQESFERLRFRKADSGVFRTLVFPAHGTSLSDVHRFCQDQCSRDTCCDGFILNQNTLNGGSFLCGLMRAPSVLLCADQDWDMIGQGKANRVCGAGLIYNKQQRSFIFNFGGQEFTITDSALPANSKNKTDYQASIISFQAIYLQTGAESSSSSSSSCPEEQPRPALDVSVQRGFESLPADSVQVDPMRSLPVLSFLLNKQHYNSQQALLWCLTRCVSEEQCLLVDVRDEAPGFLTCELLPDSRVCGRYDSPLRLPCRHLLATTPHNAFVKTVDVSGPVKSFYRRVSFQKMVSYSVRSRTSLKGTPLSDGFLECERHCDEDPCCRGFGFVNDTKSPGGTNIVCLSLISLGVQICGEDDKTRWRSQDCRPSGVKTNPSPFGWYQKPVNKWSRSPALCPPFSIPAPKTNVSLDKWNILHDSSLLVDPSLSSYDVIHISQDIAGDRKKTREWCLSACEEAESCLALSISQTESAIRCVLYPDTRACGPNPAHNPTSPASSCRLVIKEPAPLVYLKEERLPLVTSVLIPGHGALRGVAMDTVLGADRKSVIQYLGVPYASPPIGLLRFRPPQPANWTGTWDASKPRPSCIQPGDVESPASSEDCLYLNIFIPTGLTGPVPVMVFFFNPSANQSPGLLDGSTLSAVGNIVVVTASYRTAVFGFLSTGSSSLPGNYGLADQVAALRWVNDHITLMGGDNKKVTVGAERRGADITSLHLLSPSSFPSSPPLFQRIMLMGGSVFSPTVVQSVSSSKRQTVQLARELGCLTSDLDEPNESNMAACLRLIPAHTLNVAQTKLLSASGPLQAWSPVSDGVLVSRAVNPSQPDSDPTAFHSTDLLLGTSAQDGLISRARRIKDFEALQGRTDGKTAFYQALSNSLGGEQNSSLLKEAASWFYSFQHSPSPAGYNLFSRALDNATRDLFIVCPSLQMASHWASRQANVFLYHLPEAISQNRADVSMPLDVQLVFGIPNDPISFQRFTSTERRLSLAMMTYISNFIKTGVRIACPEAACPQQREETGVFYDSLGLGPALLGVDILKDGEYTYVMYSADQTTLCRDPNQPRGLVPGVTLPVWTPVLPPPTIPSYKETAPELHQRQGLRQAECSFWTQFIPKLTGHTVALGATVTSSSPAAVPTIQSQTEKDAYS